MVRKASPEEAQAAAQLEQALQEEGNGVQLQTAPGGDKENDAAPSIAGGESNAEAPQTVAPKRGRGRPSKAEQQLRESVGAAPTGDTSSGAKRGPKPKGGKSDPGVLAKSLMGIHTVVAMVTGIPEAQLKEEEAQALAEGVCAVCEEYGLAIDGKTGATMQLVGALGMIYGPRIFFYKMRIAQTQAQANANGQSNAAGN